MLKSRFNIQGKSAEEEEEQPYDEGKGQEKTEKKMREEFTGEEAMEETMEPAIVKEAEEEYPQRNLHRSEVAENLSLLGKTADGDGYTYLKATITNMKLTHIDAIKFFRHLQFVDVSQNYLNLRNLQAVAELPYLVLIHADNNVLYSAALKKAKYLQVMIFNYNKIKSVQDVFQPELSTLEIGYNKIRSALTKSKMPNLKCLDLRYNLIEDIIDINYPMLDSLYLAGNQIKCLIGLENLVNLRILHVRSNPIKLLDGFSQELKKLQYINLRNCKVHTLKQIKKLKVLPGLMTLVITGCPYMGGTGEEDADAAQGEDDPEIRIEVLATLTNLKRLNKSVVSPEERNEAKDLIMQWLEEGEKDDEEEVVEEMEDESNVDD